MLGKQLRTDLDLVTTHVFVSRLPSQIIKLLQGREPFLLRLLRINESEKPGVKLIKKRKRGWQPQGRDRISAVPGLANEPVILQEGTPVSLRPFPHPCRGGTGRTLPGSGSPCLGPAGTSPPQMVEVGSIQPSKVQAGGIAHPPTPLLLTTG